MNLVAMRAFLGTGLTLVVAFSAFLVSLVRLRRRRMRRIAGGVIVLLALYAVALLLASLLSHDTLLARGERRCFDDWCVAVADVQSVAALDGAPTGGVLLVVTLNVSSRAKRITQRPNEPRFWIVESRGRRYDVSPTAQAAWERTHGPARPVNDQISPGESFATPLVFALPAVADRPALIVAEGPPWIGRLLIGSEDSPFHGRTKVLLREP